MGVRMRKKCIDVPFGGIYPHAPRSVPKIRGTRDFRHVPTICTSWQQRLRPRSNFCAWWRNHHDACPSPNCRGLHGVIRQHLTSLVN